SCTPSHLRLLLAAGMLTRQGLALKKALVGGEPIDEATWQLIAQSRATDFYNVYGPTECTVNAAICAVKSSPARPTIGHPLANVQAHLLDRHLQPVPIGVPGELYVGGEGVARGYFNRPELTAERFVPDPFADTQGARLYETGDLARYLPDGRIEFLGRVDRQVKVRGFRIELDEIEATLAQHPAVKESVVTVRGDSSGGGSLVAYVVPTPAHSPTVGG